ncbi:MAG: exopolysaccharide Pel transporter PelG [Vulcanimicrobiota bacterium]
MAGIGFLLKNLINEDRYASDMKANLYTLIISSGPWVMAVTSLAALSVFAHHATASEEMLVFRAIVIYSYAFSLILSSIFQLILTRFISDKLYQREYDSLLPNFIGVLTLSGLLNFIASTFYMALTPLPFIVKALSVVLFCAIGFQWIVMVFLSTVRDYIKVTLIFFIGFITSFVLSLTMGEFMNLTGYLMGFTIGQVLTLIFLIQRVSEEFPLGTDMPFEFLRYMKKYPILVWAAFLYNAGFWSDKLIVWYSPYGYDIGGSFRGHVPYDSASFLAALTIIPSLSLFFLKVETDFFEGLRRYINTILNKGTYSDVERESKNLLSLLKLDLFAIFKLQILITLIIFLLAPNILRLLGYIPEELSATFMVCLVGFLFQVLFLTMIVLFWYLELLRESLVCIVTFVISNTIINLVLINFTSVLIGTGYMLSACISFVVAYFLLMEKIKDLDYRTFMQSPLHEGQMEMPKFKAGV